MADAASVLNNQAEKETVISELGNDDTDNTATGWDYYWRDYLGAVPHDAIPGGHDVSNNKTYVGQGFYRAGLLTGTIYPGKRGIKLPYRGQALAEIGVKILCSPNRDFFSWDDAESSTLYATTFNKHLVIGGCEHDEVIHVGRAMYQGELIVGKVKDHGTGNAKMYFVHGGMEFSVDSYQVLVYAPKC